MKSLPLPPLPPLARGARVWLAYSGGLDSTALLHALARLKLPLRAVHVHHGLQTAADAWARRCRAQCRALGVPLRVLRVDIADNDPAGPEAAARAARYAALRAVLRAGDVLVTAHHQDDQAETLLLRLLRGSGVAGLAAMRELMSFAPGQLWRPLLHTPRATIRAYAAAQGLAWIDDPHNVDPRYARSWLRAEILPRLTQRWPQAAESLARAAQHAREATELLDMLAADDLRAQVETGDAALSVSQLLALPAARRNNLLRYWLAQQGREPPSTQQLARLVREVLRARADTQPLLRVGDYELRRYRDRLHAMAPLPPPPKIELAWNGAVSLSLPPGCGTLVSSARRGLTQGLTVRFAHGGERLRPVGDAHTRTLKQLFQSGGVPPWQRVRMPLIYRGDQLLSVADRWLDADWAAELKRRRLTVQWLPPA